MQRKKRYRKWIAMLTLVLMSISVLPGLSFAETLPDAGDGNSASAEVIETEPGKDNKQDEENLEAGEVENVAGKQKNAKATDGTVTVRLAARGNGSFNCKLSGAADETIKEIYAGKTGSITAAKGDELELTSYALDGNKTDIQLRDAKLMQETSFGSNCKLVRIRITGGDPSVTVSFAGGESLLDAPVQMMARSRSASMSAYVSLVKYQYGYKSNGQQNRPNKYGLFTSGTSGVYGGAVYCAEHDRTPTTGSITGQAVTDTTLRKIMYYGYRGPGQWSGFASSSYNGAYKLWGSNTNRTEVAGTVITSQALSNRYNALGGRGTVTNPAGLNAFMSYINSMPDPGSSYTVYKATARGQDMMWGVYNPKGKLQLKKEVKSNKRLVEECGNMYSLEGAEYYVSKNSDGSGYVGMFTTKEDGSTDPIELDAGRYYVKEVKAPNGYALDTEVYAVDVSSGSTSWVTSKEEPLFDPVAIMLFKTSDGVSYLNTDRDMSGAEFEIAYYDEMFDSADEAADKIPVRKWVLQTQKNNNTNTYQASLRDKYKVSGDAFFKNEQGSIVIPRGTITIREIKAPKGFKIDSKVYVTHVDNDLNSNDKLVYNFGNTPEQPNKPLVPVIKTTAMDKATADNVGSRGKTVTIADTVAYKELSEGETYTVKGTLMDKSTGLPLMVDGKTVSSEKTFTVTKDNSTIDGSGARGTVDLTYTLDSRELEGKTTVVFEYLYHDGKEIAHHAEISDEGQSVHFPKIRTTAKSEETGGNLGMPRKDETIVDTVKYHNLIPGKEYTVKGKLMDKSTGKPLKDEAGKEITSEKTFTPSEKEGEVEISFVYNSLLRQGKTTVVFEDLYHNGIEVATHSDINDEGQSINYPNIHTLADIKTPGVNSVRNNELTIIDKVSYKNLVPGKKYTVKGTLMDKSTGKPFIAGGKEVHGTTTFTPQKKDGIVMIEFVFPADAIDGKTVVVFEDLYNENIKIATHSDLQDEGQTVAVGRLDVEHGFSGYPLTGDNTKMWIFASVLLLAAGGLLLVVKSKGKKNNKNE